MTEQDDTAVRDAAGTAIEPGDHVVRIGDPARAMLVTAVDPAGTVYVHAGREEIYELRARLLRVVTIRDAAGTRLGAGDIVRAVGPADGPTYVIGRIDHAAHLVRLAGEFAGRREQAAIPALLVRVGSAVMEGDTVVDQHGVLGVVMVAGPDRVQVAPVDGGPRLVVDRAELRRVDDEPVPAVQVDTDGSFRVPVLDGDGGLDAEVQALVRGDHLATVLPFQRAATGS